MQLLYSLGGVVAGFIDSIAGGGGLITLPLLIFEVGSPVEAIGSNKIVGVVGAAVAMWVYRRGGHLDWRRGLVFSVWVALGSFCGSSVSPLLPKAVFKWIIAAICPVLIWVVWRKDSLIVDAAPPKRAGRLRSVFEPALVLSGLACGFYDGAVGPGGGTFMFFALLYVVRLPLLAAMAVSKLSNTLSAGTALVRFASGGYVHWWAGSCMAAGMALGAYIGARCATKRAAQLVKPVFTVVVLMLIARLMTM